jgi:hypothetical protein
VFWHGYHGKAMTDDHRNATDEQRRLVQRILAGGIPKGKEFDACRAVLQSGCNDDEAFAALLYLLQGAVADPFLGIDETRLVVQLLKALTRREIRAGELT